MTKETKQRPIETLRDGNIKAAIWKNESDNGTFYAITFSRTYKDGDDYKDTESFSGSQLLRLARLAGKAYDRTNKLRAADRAAAETDEGEGA